MSELSVPDELFDADFASHEHSLAHRFDWIIQDGQIIHAPVVGWTWACRKCGEAGTLPGDPVRLASLHGTQHAAGPFSTLVPLLVSVVRKFPPTTPSSTSYRAELLAEAPAAMTVRGWLAARALPFWEQRSTSPYGTWRATVRRRISFSGGSRRGMPPRPRGKKSWPTRSAVIHPVYPMVTVLARFWAVDGKHGPLWDGTGVRLVSEDGSELCTFDLGDTPETTAGP